MQSPFRFIPIAPYVYQPEWTKQVSHDHPFKDGFNGEFQLTISAQSPICVGGKQIPASESAPGRVCFYKTPTGEYAIPGTSIKGMLRNVLKIASFGRMEQLEDQRLGVRDISKSKTFAGWLTFDNGQWQVTSCDYARVHQTEIIRHFNINDEFWKSKLQSAQSRYNKLGGLQNVQFSQPHANKQGGKEAEKLGSGECSGILVVTGQPGADSDYTRRGGKKKEFVFYNYQSSNAEKVPMETMAAFMQVHEDSSEWKYWKPRVAQLGQQGLGVPVFFHKSPQGEISSMGLAYMYKLAYRNSLHGALNNSSRDHLDQSKIDLAELIFGRIDSSADRSRVDDRDNSSLRGRIGCSSALLQELLQTSIQQPTVLSSPKPTFYPAYIEQPNPEKAYKTLMDSDARLAGWKRYPVKHSHDIPELDAKVKANKKVQVELETLPAGANFSGKIRFHNLRLIELGALLWVIDFDRNDNYRHNIGAGKPFGFGQILLEARDFELQANWPHEEPDEVLLEAAREAFKQRMQSLWSELNADTDSRSDWLKSPQIANLLAMCEPETFSPADLEYPGAPKNFVKLKQDQAHLPPPENIPDQRLNIDRVEAFEPGLERLIKAGEEALNQREQARALAEEKVKRQLAKASMSERQIDC